VNGIVDGHQTTDLYPHPDFFRFVWRWNGKQWQADPPTPTVGVPIELFQSMCFDSARNALILFGGQGEGSFDVTNYTYEILYQDDPVVLKQRTVQQSLLGQNTKIRILAAGAIINYQWQKDGVNLTDTANLQGSTTDTLQLASVGPGDGGIYSVVLSNLCGIANSQPIQLLVSTTTQISISQGAVAGAPFVISWPDPDLVLQNAPTPAGPWTDVPGAISPFSVVLDQQQKFFRVRN
jgi:hypothetical protein